MRRRRSVRRSKGDAGGPEATEREEHRRSKTIGLVLFLSTRTPDTNGDEDDAVLDVDAILGLPSKVRAVV